MAQVAGCLDECIESLECNSMGGCDQPRQHYLCVMHLTLSYAMKRIADGRWVRGAASKDECKIGTTQHEHRLARKKESHNIGYEVWWEELTSSSVPQLELRNS